MFSKEERKEIHEGFWKRFKSYTSKLRNEDGRRINWLNYPTSLKQIYVRLHADNQCARFSIEIQDKDEGVRDLIWEQFHELQKVMENEMPEPGVWSTNAFNLANQPIYRISWTLDDVNMYKTHDEEAIFEFYKKHLIGFDKFYTDFKEVLFGLLK